MAYLSFQENEMYREDRVFPGELAHSHPNFSDGLCIRDWFAGQIAAGMCANHGSYGQHNGPGDIAERAYEIADALMTQRAKPAA